MGTDSETSFESALRDLETIVERLERGEGDLSQALAGYERGVRLLADCQRILDAAERSVALLTGVDPAGNPATAPFDTSATADREAPAITQPRPARPSRPRSTPRQESDDHLPY